MEQLPEAPQSRGFISTLFFWFENTNRGRDDYFETVTLHNGSGWKLAFSLAENYKGVNCRSSIWREVGERATTTVSEVEIWQKLSWQFMPRLKRGLHFLISAREMLSSRCESAEEPSSVDLNLVNALSNQENQQQPILHDDISALPFTKESTTYTSKSLISTPDSKLSDVSFWIL